MGKAENNSLNERMKDLVGTLDLAAKAYYQESREIMSNYEYDKLYDELLQLEAETGIVMAGSPTAKVGYEILSDLPKEKHASRMLSLDKTKEVEALKDWLGSHKGLLSWKLDGLTIVLTYEGGQLIKAVFGIKGGDRYRASKTCPHIIGVCGRKHSVCIKVCR